jgi:hypothetical protein
VAVITSLGYVGHTWLSPLETTSITKEGLGLLVVF